MNQEQETLQKLTGKDLEVYGAKIFESIGLRCFSSLCQIRLNSITSGYSEDKHIEFDYIISNKKVCLIGEITARDSKEKLKSKYDNFVKNINVIRNIKFSEYFWMKLGIQEKDTRYFREIEFIKAFFIITKKERFDVSLSTIQDISVFYKSDFLRIIEYSQTIGRWTRNYFLKNFNIKDASNSAISIYQKDNLLIRSRNRKVSGRNIPLSNLYTFIESPYNLLDIAHVYRKDELPSQQNDTYNYQRLLDGNKLRAIRKELLTTPKREWKYLISIKLHMN